MSQNSINPHLRKFFCRHLQSTGFCRFHDQCLFSHSNSAYKIPENVCFFDLKGICKKRNCSFLHISAIELINQLRALQNYNNDRNQESDDNDVPSTSRSTYRHRNAFKNRRDDWTLKDHVHEERICGICLENVTNNKSFGLLCNCTHIFCMDCIVKWRRTKNSAEDNNNKNCPECRTPSTYVIPSRHFATGEDKQKIIDNFKNSRKDTICKFEKDGVNYCRNKESCFYRHNLPFRERPLTNHRRAYAYSLTSANLILNTFLSDSSDDDIHISIYADSSDFL